MPSSRRTRLFMIVISLIYALPLTCRADAMGGEGVANWGDISTSLVGLGQIFGQFMMTAALCIGLGFSLSAALKYKYHRNNPTAIPISVPLLHLFFGLVLIVLALFFNASSGYVFGEQGGQLGVFNSMLQPQ